ncbi:MAG: polysaccharide deacetylase family protein [candidate division KSB1 bacterium]|nr:polysaccharide deacetylase family protein [candidate division KSB1 bacterium]MDZ7295784.1 polysaccharide deacetylase family protein [candidate division KSB1 bacterium]MDZ7386454.1 polysaccharide deacetylase family protein [candidate division KSB1 bacterium]
MVTLAYHLVDRRFYAGITRVTPRAFAAQMSYLSRGGFVCRLPTLPTPVQDKSGPREICITFDDGYQCVYDYAYPIMESMQLRGTVFVIAGYVGKTNAWDVRLSKPVRHMGWGELGALVRSGWEIGSHSMTHAALSFLSPERLRKEVGDSKLLLEDRLGCPIRAFSYPFGVLDERLVDKVREAGYQVAFAMYVPPRLRRAGLSPFNRARTAVYLTDSMRGFAAKAQGGNGAWQVVVARVVNFCSRGTILLKT